MTIPGAPPPWPALQFASGSGMVLHDSNGHSYLDMTAGMACVQIGHSRPEMARALHAQLQRLPVCPLFADMCHPGAQELAERLQDWLEPEGVHSVLFSNGGSDAVETAIKLARQFWQLSGQTNKVQIFAFRQAYHGTHYGAASASGLAVLQQGFGPLLPGFSHFELPFALAKEFPGPAEHCADLALRQLARAIAHQGAGTIAALIAEPVPLGAGIHVPPPNFWPGLRALCDAHDILLIADEVSTGFGRTGEVLACRHWAVRPDLMCLGKGLSSGYVPVGATTLNARVAQAWAHGGPGSALVHGYSSSGHPLACAAALTNLDLLERDDLLARCRAQGQQFLKDLQSLQTLPLVAEVRGLGLMLALALRPDPRTGQAFSLESPTMQALRRATLDQGVLLRLHPGLVLLTPPLIASASDLARCTQALHTALAPGLRACVNPPRGAQP